MPICGASFNSTSIRRSAAASRTAFALSVPLLASFPRADCPRLLPFGLCPRLGLRRHSPPCRVSRGDEPAARRGLLASRPRPAVALVMRPRNTGGR